MRRKNWHRVLYLIGMTFSLFTTSANAYSYNESHIPEFTNHLESAKINTLQVVLLKETKYPFASWTMVQTSATGTLLDNGYILTNQHVTNFDYTEIIVNTYDNKQYSAEMIASDSELDLALLHISEKNLKGFKLAESEVYPGMGVMTVGQPYGLPRWSFCEGFIEIVDQVAIYSTGGTYKAIMTSAQILPGNSGGPLLNKNGELVGIMRAKSIDHSFAIPLKDIRSFLNAAVIAS